jgi:hypothetical protein
MATFTAWISRPFTWSSLAEDVETQSKARAVDGSALLLFDSQYQQLRYTECRMIGDVVVGSRYTKTYGLGGGL